MLGGLLVLLLGSLFALTLWASHAATNPRHSVFDAPRLGDALPREPVWLTSRDGTRLASWFIAGRRRAAVLLLHGYTACKDDMLSHAAFLHDAGYSLFLLDLRACGDSHGTAVTLGGREREDVAAALAYLRARPDSDAEQVGILGLSLGGALAILAACDTPGVRAVVAESAFRSVRSAVQQNFRRFTRLPNFPCAELTLRLTEWQHGVRAARVAPEREVARLRGCALLLIHAEDDAIIAVDDAQAIYRRAPEPKELWLVPSAPHAMAFNTLRQTYATRVVAFFDRWLLPESSTRGADQANVRVVPQHAPGADNVLR